MLTDDRRRELSDVLRPVAPPREITDIYTADQRERLLDVVRTQDRGSSSSPSTSLPPMN